MIPHKCSLLLLAALLSLQACADDMPSPDALLAKNAKNKCIPQRGDVCDSPSEGSVDPVLPGPGFQLVSPVRIAVTGTGWLLVTETHRQAVLRVDPTTLVADQSLLLSGRPHAIGMLGDRIYVGNNGTQVVEVYGHDGQALGTLGEPGSVRRPMDLATDSVAGLVFVLDGHAKRVNVYDPADGSLLRSVGAFVTPVGIDVDPLSQEVFVADAGPIGGDAGVVIFRYDGTVVQTISGAGTCGMLGCSGGFSTPSSVAVGPAGRVLVLDVLQAAVLVYDRASPSRPVETIGGRTATPTLGFPLDVTVVGSDLVVTSKRTHSIEAFRGVLP